MEGSSVTWKPFSLTHVEYPEGDPLGKFLALVSLLPLAMIVGNFTLILFRRDLHTISLFLGNILCEASNLALKKLIRQPRPYVREFQAKDFGMPSSHSQLSCFFATYAVLFVVFRLHHNHQSVFERLWKGVVCGGVLAAAALVVYSRVYLLYHSAAQVAVGSALGVCLGAAWFALVHLLLAPLFPAIANWRVSELLMVRDTTLIPNILWFEYTTARTEGRARGQRRGGIKRS